MRTEVTDPQFLLRTQIRVQLAVLFVALSLLGAFGLMLVVDQSLVPDVAENRRAAARELERVREELLPAVENKIRQVQSQLDGSAGVAEEMRRKKEKIAAIEARLESMRRELSSTDDSEHFDRIHQYLAANAYRMRYVSGPDEIRGAVTRYLNQSPTSAEFDRAVMAYLDEVFQKAKLEAELAGLSGPSRRERLLREKEDLEAERKQLREAARNLEEQSSWTNLLKFISISRLRNGLLILLAAAWLLLWLGGISIETAELFIDMATNVRRMRRLAEGNPQGTVIFGDASMRSHGEGNAPGS